MFNRQAERITRAVNRHTSLESFRVLMDKLLKLIFLISIRFSSHRALDQDEMKVREKLFTFDGPCHVICYMSGPFPNKFTNVHYSSMWDVFIDRSVPVCSLSESKC